MNTPLVITRLPLCIELSFPGGYGNIVRDEVGHVLTIRRGAETETANVTLLPGGEIDWNAVMERVGDA